MAKSKHKPPADDEKFRKLFPTAHAVKAADAASDKVSPMAPLTAHTDAWIAAYLAAGGITEVV